MLKKDIEKQLIEILKTWFIPGLNTSPQEPYKEKNPGKEEAREFLTIMEKMHLKIRLEVLVGPNLEKL